MPSLPSVMHGWIVLSSEKSDDVQKLVGEEQYKEMRELFSTYESKHGYCWNLAGELCTFTTELCATPNTQGTVCILVSGWLDLRSDTLPHVLVIVTPLRQGCQGVSWFTNCFISLKILFSSNLAHHKIWNYLES